jgi:hypothetical protein
MCGSCSDDVNVLADSMLAGDGGTLHNSPSLSKSKVRDANFMKPDVPSLLLNLTL